MEFMISGRNLTVSDRFREYAGEKISKIESLGDKVQRVDAKVSKETNARQTGDQLTVEVTVLGRGPVIRAEASAADKFAAFDLAYNKLLERLRRAKDRKKVHHGRHTPKAVREATATLEPASANEPIYVEASHRAEPAPEPAEKSPYDVENDIPAGDSPVLIRRKVFPAASLTLDDAVDNMELIGHDFYLFVDKATNAPSVVYRRRGWTYGVITLDHYCEPGENTLRREDPRLPLGRCGRNRLGWCPYNERADMGATLSLTQARRIALAAQGLDKGRPAGPVTSRTVGRTFARIQLVQIDSVNVLARSHFLPFFSRLGNYDRAILQQMAGRHPRRMMEYWAHEASFIRPEHFQDLVTWQNRTWVGASAMDPGAALRRDPTRCWRPWPPESP